MKPGDKIDVLDHGYVRYVDHFGSDGRIVEAARISYASPSKGAEADRKLLHYLYRNRHTSPFEQCNITFNIKMPIFVMRQFVRHRTFRLNEVSARYTELPEEFYKPSTWRQQDTKNKQGSTEPVQVQANLDQAYFLLMQDCFGLYKQMIYEGVAREMARFILPVSVYTEIYVNCDLHNLMHFLTLRLDPHAQYEIRVYAEAMRQVMQCFFPVTSEVYSTYVHKMENRGPVGADNRLPEDTKSEAPNAGSLD